MKKIAIYSCNFGNYRNELDQGIDNLEIDEKIDCFFFTDSQTLSSKQWKIIESSPTIFTTYLDKNRYASKKIKFILPKILKTYDILIWIDSKYLKRGKIGLKFHDKLLNYNEIVEKMEVFDILHQKHPQRESVMEEIHVVISKKKERKGKANKYLKSLSDKKHRLPLIETGYIIRNNTSFVRKLFKKTFANILKYSLRRDQLVYPFAIDEVNFPTEKISFCLCEPPPKLGKLEVDNVLHVELSSHETTDDIIHNEIENVNSYEENNENNLDS